MVENILNTLVASRNKIAFYEVQRFVQTLFDTGVAIGRANSFLVIKMAGAPLLNGVFSIQIEKKHGSEFRSVFCNAIFIDGCVLLDYSDVAESPADPRKLVCGNYSKDWSFIENIRSEIARFPLLDKGKSEMTAMARAHTKRINGRNVHLPDINIIESPSVAGAIQMSSRESCSQ